MFILSESNLSRAHGLHAYDHGREILHVCGYAIKYFPDIKTFYMT
jgi:hypothetical protein